MLAGNARPFSLSSRLAQLARCTALAAVVLAAGSSSLQRANANGDTRTLSFHNVHTGEDLTVTFKRNGQYDQAGLKKLNWFMRDWRRSEETGMEPQLFDALWTAYQATGASEPIHVISAYRSPNTNSMLRARSRGVAQGSLHTHGQAMDFFIPGVPLSKIREVGLKMQRGGVGFYPTSGSPFVHLDVGTIRHWPRMTRDQLVKVFPNERTVHVPSDGKPLAGFALALADVERQGRAPSNVLLANARNSGAIDDDVVTFATTSKPAAPAKPKVPTLLASFFTFKPGTGETETPKAEPEANDKKPDAADRIVTASLTAPTPVSVQRIVPMPKVRPGATMTLASVTPTVTLSAAAGTPMPRMRPVAAPVAVAAVPRDLFEHRGLWASIGQDKVDEMTTASTGPVLAYAPQLAPQSAPQPARAAAPMGGKAASRIAAAPLAPVRSANAPAPTPAKLAQIGQLGQRFEDPWMRAVLMTPNVRAFMTTAQMVRRDNRVLGPLMAKPDSTVVMAFSHDPHAGMTSDRFSGDAVVFVATATFRLRTTAALVR